MKKTLFALGFALSAASTAHGHSEKFLPENNFHLEDWKFQNNSNITEDMFNEIIDRVETYYSNVVASHGATLVMQKNWSDSTVNAYAQQSGNDWIVSMFGGLARRPETTPDGFAMVVCHELGHHLGGFFFYGDAEWASSEGQSDYFATMTCAKRIWADTEADNANYRSSVDPFAKTKCDEIYNTEAEQNICYRTAMAGQSLATLLASLGGDSAPRFDTPDQAEISSSSASHPAAQCRMDTYFSGALCNKAFDEMVIPGKDAVDGRNSLSAEKEAANSSCMSANFEGVGLRPRCWFKPSLSISLDVASNITEEVTGNGNGIFEPGETFSMNIPLSNNLKDNLVGATLAIETPAGQTSTVNYPDIPFGTTASADDLLMVEIPETQACGTSMAATGVVTVGGRTLRVPFQLPMGGYLAGDSAALAVDTNIPDNDQNGLSSMISMSSNEMSKMVDVELDIAHTYMGDLVITLTSPTGETFDVMKRKGGSQDNFKGTVRVEITNQAVAGDWTLNVSDRARRDTGKLVSWGLSWMKYTCEVHN